MKNEGEKEKPLIHIRNELIIKEKLNIQIINKKTKKNIARSEARSTDSCVTGLQGRHKASCA